MLVYSIAVVPRPEPVAAANLTGFVLAIGHLTGSGFHESSLDRFWELFKLSPLASFLLGVISTVIGAFVASKIHVYHEARSPHRDEIKKQVLQPMLDALQQVYAPLSRHETAVAQLTFGVKTVDHSVRAEEPATTHGNYLVAKNPYSVAGLMNQALLLDSVSTHHRRLMRSWIEFCDKWDKYRIELLDWIKSLEKQISERTALPITPTVVNGPYAMHLHLAVFIYERLFEIGGKSLNTGNMGGARYSLFDGAANLATGTNEEIEGLLRLVNELLNSNREIAEILRHKLGRLELRIGELIRQVSVAIAAKKLRGRCDFVPFF